MRININIYIGVECLDDLPVYMFVYTQVCYVPSSLCNEIGHDLMVERSSTASRSATPKFAPRI